MPARHACRGCRRNVSALHASVPDHGEVWRMNSGKPRESSARASFAASILFYRQCLLEMAVLAEFLQRFLVRFCFLVEEITERISMTAAFTSDSLQASYVNLTSEVRAD